MKSSVMIKPNNRTFILASLIFLLLAVHAQQAFSGVFQKTKDNELSPKQMITLQIIHQLSWSAQKIYTYNDKIALFEEQAALSSDGLDLSVFKKDTKTRDLYAIVKELRDTIFKIELSEDERRKLEEFQEDERTIAFIQNSNIFQGVNVNPKRIKGDPYTELALMGTKVLTNLGNGVSNYLLIRKKLELELKIKLWEEEKKNRKMLHELMQKFDESVKNAIVEILPKDKELRTTLAHIKELVENVKKANLNGNSPEENNKTQIDDLLNFLQCNERYYQYFPMYWYYRGVCEQYKKNNAEAIKAYERYQQLDIGLIKYNKISASVAMNTINLLLQQKSNKTKVYDQLSIIYKNIDIQDNYWNLPYYAGLVYLYKFNDIDKAKKMLKTAEEKLSRKYKDDWQAFQVRLRAKNGLPLPTSKPNVSANEISKDNNICEIPGGGSIPSGRNLYLCRLALNNAIIMEAGENVAQNEKLMDILVKIANEETTSIFEGLNYFGSTDSNRLIEKYLKELAATRILVNYECGLDELIAVLPLKCFLLREIYPTLRIYTYDKHAEKYEKSEVKCLFHEKNVSVTDTNGTTVKTVQKVLDEEVFDNYEERTITPGQKVKLIYDIEVDHMTKAKAEYIELFVPQGEDPRVKKTHGENLHGENSFSILFDLDDLSNKNIVAPFMFARAVIFKDKLYRLPATIVVNGLDDTFDDSMGGNTYWDSTQRCNGWRVQTLKWPWGNTRIVDNFNRVRLSFPKANEGAIAIKDKIWNDIRAQIEKEDYWKNWFEQNPPVTLTNENRDKCIHAIFEKKVIK